MNHSRTTSWIVLLAVCLTNVLSFGQNFDYVGFGGTFNNVDIKSNTAVAVGNGVVVYSDDKGKTWHLSNFPTTPSITLHDVDMITPLIGWAVGANGVVLKTTDGGKSWLKQSAPPVALNAILRGVYAVSESVIYAVGESVTTLSGLNPVQRGGIGSLTIGSPFPNYATLVPIPDGLYTNLSLASTVFVSGIATGLATVQVTGGVITSIIITSPGGGYTQGQQVYIPRNQFPGSTSTLVAVSPHFTVTSLTSPTAQPHINNHIILKSIDGGASWVSLLDAGLPVGLSHLNTSQFWDVKFIDQNIGYVVGRSGFNTFDGGGGKILKTIDGGISWTVTTLYDDANRLISAPTTNIAQIEFRSIALFGPNIVYAAGTNRILYKSVDGGVTWNLLQSSLKSITGISGISHTWGNIYGTHPDSLIIANQSSTITTDYSSIASNNGGVNFTRRRVPNGFVGPNQLAGDGNCVILVGTGGQISLSTDKGVTFTPIMENRIVGTRGIFFPSKLIGYAFGDGGVVYKTIDGGLNWFNPISGGGAASNLQTSLQSAWFFNDTKGLIAGSESSPGGAKLLATNDGGITWVNESSKVANANLFDIFFSSPTVGWAVGNSTTTSVVYKSIDGGLNWTLQSNLPFSATTINQALSIYFVDALTGFIGGFGGRLYKTIDGGTTWINLDLSNDFTGGAFTINDVWFADANKGFVAGSNGMFAHTTDGGMTWDSTAIFNPTTGLRETAIINKMEWLDANEGYIVGEGGFHYYTLDGGRTFTRFTPNTQAAFAVATNPSWPYKANSPMLPCNLYVAYLNGIIGTAAEKYFQDKDKDGLGDGTQPFDLSFVPIEGFVTNDRDCDDSNPDILSIPVGFMTCHDKLNISLDSTCDKRIRPEMLLVNQSACLANFQVTIAGQASDIIPALGKYVVTVKDLISGNSCWSEILVEDKLPPIIKCIDTLKVSCISTTSSASILPTVLECSNYKLDKVITLGKENCGLKDTIITYTATDHFGNKSAPCIQVIKTTPLILDSIVIPSSSAVVPACEGDLSPSYLALITHDTFAYPTIFTGGSYLPIIKNIACNILVDYRDDIYDMCDTSCNGGKKIFRTWTLRDWCANKKIDHIQTIKAVDIQAPTFTSPNVTIDANLWKCDGEYVVKRPSDLADNCDPSPTWKITSATGIVVTGNATDGYKLSGLKKGINYFTILAEDCCGNIGKQDGSITVLDRTGPVIILKEKLVINLITDVTETGGDRGEAKLFAKDVDNGSYDNCGPIKVEIRRPLGAPRCDNIGTSSRNNNVTFNNNGSGNDVTTWAHPDDHNSDTDNGEFVKFCCEDLADEYQQVIIRVWDDGNMNGIAGDNLIINGLRDNYAESWADIKVELKTKPILKCPDDIVIDCNAPFDISTELVTATNLDIPTGKATLDITCGGIALRYIDKVNEKSCGISSVERTFLGISRGDTSRCTQIIVFQYNSQLVVSPLDTTPIRVYQCSLSKEDFLPNGSMYLHKPKVLSGPCDLIAENIEVEDYEIENGVCKKWVVNFSYINWCTSDKANVKVYFYFKDTIAPIIESSNQMFEVISTNGECKGSAKIIAKATDANQCTNDAWLKWQVAIDINSDGSIDNNYGSYYTMTDPRYLKPSASDETITLNLLPIINSDKIHTVYWAVSDGCGNTTRDTSTFMVIDKKAPTPYCISLSTAYMKNCIVELWAKDFDKGAYDNCTPSDQLLFTFGNAHPVLNKINEVHFFKGQGLLATAAEYQNGDAQKWSSGSMTAGKIFDVDDFEETSLMVTVWDKNFNHDFCTVNLNIIDNQGDCLMELRGEIKTRKEVIIKPLEISIKAEFSGYENQFIGEGSFSMPNMINDNYKVVANKNDDFPSGVSTIDLVLMQRHILGLEKLEDPYTLIAADINSDGKINSSDLVELRKLILGTVEKFSNQSSWVFIPKSYSFNGANPEVIKNGVIVKASDIDKTAKLVGIKIGDINQDIIMNQDVKIAKPRSSQVLQLSNAYVKLGEIFEVTVKATESLSFHGLQSQFELSFDLLDVNSSFDNIAFNHINNSLSVVLVDGKNNKVDKGEVLFTIQGKATRNGYLSEMLSLIEDRLLPEIYGQDHNISSLSYRFDNSDNNAMAVSQNEPNPFSQSTTIQVDLPVEMPFEFIVLDATSKVILRRNIAGRKGNNSVLVNRQDLNLGSGILFYQVKTAEQTITKKMVITN